MSLALNVVEEIESFSYPQKSRNRYVYKLQRDLYYNVQAQNLNYQIRYSNHRLMKTTILMKIVSILHETVNDAAAPSYTFGDEEVVDDEPVGTPFSDPDSEPLPELLPVPEPLLPESFPDSEALLELFPESLLPEFPSVPELVLPALLLEFPPFPDSLLPEFSDPPLL